MENGAPGKERRAGVAWFSEGFGSETDPAGLGRREESPRRSFDSGGGIGLDGRAVFGSSPQPSGLHELQAAFTAARPAANWVTGANGIARCLG